MGKAQRESARRRKSDCGKSRGLKFSGSKVTYGLKSNALAYAKRALSTKGRYMGVGTGGAEGAAAPPTFGTGEQAIALAPQKV